MGAKKQGKGVSFMLRTRGRDIIQENGDKVVLRGINLGSWALLESNMIGIPGVEHRVMRAIKLYAGEKKAERFLKGVLEKWVTEDDIAFLKDLGCNSVRLPLNYRRFENDDRPFEYMEEGFSIIDRLLEYCKKYNMYVIIDLHGVQGYQNGDWHSDNAFGQVSFYYDKIYQQRCIALWKAIAERYKDEEWVAGYDLINEPVASDRFEEEALNKIYFDLVKEIRKVDPNHIVFIEGNYWGTDFRALTPPFDDNVVYSPHYYCQAAIQVCRYPGEINGVMYNIDKMRADMDIRDNYMKKYNVPCWIGEFGVRRFENLEDKNRVFKDYITVFEERGHSWCYWNFKDMGLRGPLYINPDSPWAIFTEEIRRLKEKYHTDYANVLGDVWDLSTVIGQYENGDFAVGYTEVEGRLTRSMRAILGDLLTEKFGQQFAKLSLSEIDKLTDSFLFENCLQYKPWVEILESAYKR